jgi:hypothetical protein
MVIVPLQVVVAIAIVLIQVRVIKHQAITVVRQQVVVKKLQV